MKKNSWYGSMTPPEDRVISLFAGLLANYDRAHNHIQKDKKSGTTRNDQEHRQEKPRTSKVNTTHTNQTLTIKSEP